MDYEKLKRDYFFSDEDKKNLRKIGELLSPYRERFVAHFYAFLKNFPEGSRFFNSKDQAEHGKETIKLWFDNLFLGEYEDIYWQELFRIGKVHVKRKIPIHLVTASMNYKRNFFLKILKNEVRGKADYEKLERSLLKILDMNLDVMLSSYHEERLKQVFLSKKMDNYFINLTERFTYGLNLVLVLSLLGLSLGVVGLFGYEVYQLFVGGFAKNLISALGTLLVIWVMIELLKTETEYLRGGRFQIEVFLSVALVAFIRELLIVSLSPEKVITLLVFLLAVLVLGVVYFLISRTRGF